MAILFYLILKLRRKKIKDLNILAEEKLKLFSSLQHELSTEEKYLFDESVNISAPILSSLTIEV